MNRTVARATMLLLGAWLMFRFVSDWPRGVFASGSGVPEWSLQLSYVGLVPWIGLTALFLLMMGRLQNVIAGDPIARAHLLFIVFQIIGLFKIAQAFGNDGLLAGLYIMAASITFLFAYVLGAAVGASIGEDAPTASKATLRWVTVCMAPCLAIGALQLLTGSGRDVGGIPRIFGGTSSPNVLGALLLVFIGLQLWSGTERMTTGGRALLGLSLALFVACFSLSGFAAIFFMLGAFWLMSGLKTRRLRIRASWVVGGLIVSMAVAYFADTILSERLGELQQSDNSLTWRTRTWSTYFALLGDIRFFFLGGGLGFDHLGLEQEPHNEWLRVLLETGAIGLLLFARTWWMAVRGLREVLALQNAVLQRRALGMLAIIAGLALWAAVDSVLRTAPSALLAWTAVGTLVGTARRYNAQNNVRRLELSVQQAGYPARRPQANAPS